MQIDILTIFPEMFSGLFDFSIIKRAKEKNLAKINLINIRDFSKNKHKKVDDYPYGGEAGMVMTIQPIADAIDFLKSQRKYDDIIYLTPDGIKLDQKLSNTMSTLNNIILLCGHYKGIDQRIRDLYITKEISIGDFVLSGGELAAAVLADSIIRLIPGVISDETSALTDSFQDGMLAPPVYTRPSEYKGIKVPEILLSGNFAVIEKWRMERASEKTKRLRPDMLD